MEEETPDCWRHYMLRPHRPEDFDAMARLKIMRPRAEKALQWLHATWPSLVPWTAPSQSYRARKALEAIKSIPILSRRSVFGENVGKVGAVLSFLETFVLVYEAVDFLDGVTSGSPAQAEFEKLEDIIDVLEQEPPA